MLYLVISLVVLGVVAAIANVAIQKRHGEQPPVTTPAGADCLSCSGTNTQCEQECMMEAATKPIEYFDDEELDAFKGRRADSYSEDETDQFAEVLETLRPEEVAAWGRSLTLRGINLPDSLKDEYYALAK